MQAIRMRSRASFAFLYAVFLLALAAAPGITHALPTLAKVPERAALPIDGEWEATMFGERLTFHLEKGRWWAGTAYTVALLLPVKVGEVTCVNVRAKAAGKYVGYDLVLAGKWIGTLQPDGTLDFFIKGAEANVKTVAKAIKLDNPAWFEKELAAVRKGGDQPSTTAPAKN